MNAQRSGVPVGVTPAADIALRFGNAEIACQLDAIAELLEAQNANAYRIRIVRRREAEMTAYYASAPREA